jgi:hypothetical protein
MSWQRILEMARRQKMPVVITDIAGREPMVVLPFNEYEALVEVSSTLPSPAKAEDQIHVEPIDQVDNPPPAARRPPSSGPIIVGPTTPYLGESAQPSAPAGQMPEPSLEERFSFEPIA